VQIDHRGTVSRAQNTSFARVCRAGLATCLLLGLPLHVAQSQVHGEAERTAAGHAAARRDWSAAAVAMERAIARAPRRADYHYLRGHYLSLQALEGSLLTRARLSRAILQSFERALVLDSTFDAAYAGAIPWFAQAPPVVGGSTARAETLLAQWLRVRPYAAGIAQVGFDRDRNLLRQAVEHAEALVGAFPDSARAHAELASTYGRAGRVGDARRVMELAYARWPRDPWVLYAVGRDAALHGGDLLRGERALHGVLAATTSDSALQRVRAPAHAHLGRIYERRGDQERAREQYLRAQVIDPRLRAAREGLERIR